MATVVFAMTKCGNVRPALNIDDALLDGLPRVAVCVWNEKKR